MEIEEGKGGQVESDNGFSKATIPEKTHRSRFIAALGSRSTISNGSRSSVSSMKDGSLEGTSPPTRLFTSGEESSHVFDNSDSDGAPDTEESDSPLPDRNRTTNPVDGTTEELELDDQLDLSPELRRGSSGSLKSRNAEKREERLRNLRKFSTSCPQLPRHLLLKEEALATEKQGPPSDDEREVDKRLNKSMYSYVYIRIPSTLLITYIIRYHIS